MLSRWGCLYLPNGETYRRTEVLRQMWDMYEYTRNKHGENGMFNVKEGLWWRDHNFDPPYKEPNGENCYWSRGNGWVYAALVRVMNEIPSDENIAKITSMILWL